MKEQWLLQRKHGELLKPFRHSPNSKAMRAGDGVALVGNRVVKSDQKGAIQSGIQGF